MTTSYRTKPAEVNAIQFTGDNPNEVAQFIGDDDAGRYGRADFMSVEILDDEEVSIYPGDWIVEADQPSGFIVMNNDNFTQLFEEN